MNCPAGFPGRQRAALVWKQLGRLLRGGGNAEAGNWMIVEGELGIVHERHRLEGCKGHSSGQEQSGVTWRREVRKSKDTCPVLAVQGSDGAAMEHQY